MISHQNSLATQPVVACNCTQPMKTSNVQRNMLNICVHKQQQQQQQQQHEQQQIG